MKETDLAQHFVNYFSCYDLYFEVDYGRCVDIVAMAEKFAIAIEVKTSFNFKVLEQAIDNKERFHYSYIAVPRFKDPGFQKKLCKDYGVGLLVYDERYKTVICLVPPKLNRKAYTKKLDESLHEYCKNSLPGSKNGDGTKITAFSITIDSLRITVKRNPGQPLNKIIGMIDHHYASDKTAVACIYKWINKGIITCVKLENGKLYESTNIHV